MKSLRAKLHSSSGASMVIALAFLLFCLSVGAVILTAASANAGRVSRTRENQQDFLTVSSAARLVRGALEGLTYSSSEVYTNDSGTGAASASFVPSAHSPDTLSGLVKSTAEEVFESQPVYVSPAGVPPSDVPLAVTDSGSDFDEVSAVLSMDSNYNLTVSFFLTASPAIYSLRLTFPALVNDSSSTTVTSYEDSYTVWEDVDGVPTEATYTATHEITTVTRTLSVSWDNGMITKGG